MQKIEDRAKCKLAGMHQAFASAALCIGQIFGGMAEVEADALISQPGTSAAPVAAHIGASFIDGAQPMAGVCMAAAE